MIWPQATHDSAKPSAQAPKSKKSRGAKVLLRSTDGRFNKPTIYYFVKNVSNLSGICLNVSVCAVSTGDALVSTKLRWRDHVKSNVGEHENTSARLSSAIYKSKSKYRQKLVPFLLSNTPKESLVPCSCIGIRKAAEAEQKVARQNWRFCLLAQSAASAIILENLDS